MKKRLLYFLLVGVGCFVVYKGLLRINFNQSYEVGQALDSLNGVVVYYNGAVDHTEGRNTSPDNYNIGIRYQCVEFVKRYYYEHLHHKMPDSYGHAKDFFNEEIPDGQLNKQRNLIQYRNGGVTQPFVDDLVVFAPTVFNSYGHVAIVSGVTENEVEIIQQNPGPFGKSREKFALVKTANGWKIANERILGWLRLAER
ncbi:MAG: CHAP domain-containing protein [Bacteroidia bacterium]|nr:CHAP domain-containing protein [Bacteroidia bacterium]